MKDIDEFEKDFLDNVRRCGTNRARYDLCINNYYKYDATNTIFIYDYVDTNGIKLQVGIIMNKGNYINFFFDYI